MRILLSCGCQNAILKSLILYSKKLAGSLSCSTRSFIEIVANSLNNTLFLEAQLEPSAVTVKPKSHNVAITSFSLKRRW